MVDNLHSKTTHVMKSWPWLFEPILNGLKLHDIRQKDRDFKVGDTCLLQEYDPRTAVYTGREALVEITYITSNDMPCALSSAVLDRNSCVLSIKLIANTANR